jgi:energy-coupling factor transporter ATP-binding protein EcfA2
MHITELVIKNFRGIENMTWRPNAGLNCLLGPGDGTKSTILTAIELVLSPAWSVGIDETDCFDLTTANPITITATIANPPAEWQREDAFGMLMRGWHPTDGIHDEPQAGDTPALTVRFTVADDCEPHWHIIADREPTEKTISAKQRSLCNTARIDTVDRQLTWSTGSLLTKATADHDEAATTFTRAAKAAREAFRAADHPQLSATAAQLQTTARQYGVRPRGAFTAALDSKAMHLRAGCLTLHDTVVPSRLFGLGTRRILAIALQEVVMTTPGIALIDEFEHGLEPHRIRRLLRKLQTFTAIQTFMTTHSPVCVHELTPTTLCIVRSKDHVTTVLTITDEDLRKTIRAVPESLLARRLLLCEGPTEVGIIRAIDDHWGTTSEPLASRGAIPLDGEGSNAPKRARELKTLGYDVMIFADSDGSIATEAAALRQAGIEVTMWAGSVCTEQQLFNDLPWQGVKELLSIVLQNRDEQSIRNQIIAKQLPGITLDLTRPIMDWTEAPALREVLGRTAGSAGWYKQLHLGEAVGKVLATHLATINTTNTGTVVETLRVWLHRE